MSNYVIERLLILFFAGITVWLLALLFGWLTFVSIESYYKIQDSREYHQAKMKLLNAELKAREDEKEINQQLLKEIKALE